MDAIERGTTSLRKASRHWNIPLTSLFYHLYGICFLKTRTNKCSNNKTSLGNGFLGFGYARYWVVNKLATIENESDIIDPNKVNTFPRRSTKDVLVVLALAQTS
jgi:hypothetical protein